MPSSFTGEMQQKVDGKGRMSIPADFRRVLEEGDPAARDAGANPGMYVVYGAHLKGHLKAYSVAAHTRMADAINAINPRTQDEARQKRVAQITMVGSAARLEVDRDGRVVLPVTLRDKIGLTEGEVVFLGMGDGFEIWPAATYQTQVLADIEAELTAAGPNFDPMAAIWQMSG